MMSIISWSHQCRINLNATPKAEISFEVQMMDHWLNRSYLYLCLMSEESKKWFILLPLCFVQIPMLILAMVSVCICFTIALPLVIWLKNRQTEKINEPNQWYIKCDCSENLVPVYCCHCHFHRLLFTVFTLKIVIRFDFLLLFVISFILLNDYCVVCTLHKHAQTHILTPHHTTPHQQYLSKSKTSIKLLNHFQLFEIVGQIDLLLLIDFQFLVDGIK